MTKRSLALACLLLLAGAVALAQVPNIPQFSADMKWSNPEGQPATGKMYWGGGKMRMDMNMQGRQAVMIHDISTKTSYMLMPEQHMYMEMSANNPMMQRLGNAPNLKPFDPANPCASMEGYTCKKIGAETVNGRSCDKWEFKGPSETQTAWVDQKLHFPIRSVTSNGTTMDLTNLQEGSQPASLFEIPAGYTKMDFGMHGRRPN